MKREAYIPDKLNAEWSRAFPNADFSMAVRQMMKDQLDELESVQTKNLFERMYRAGAR